MELGQIKCTNIFNQIVFRAIELDHLLPTENELELFARYRAVYLELTGAEFTGGELSMTAQDFRDILVDKYNELLRLLAIDKGCVRFLYGDRILIGKPLRGEFVNFLDFCGVLFRMRNGSLRIIKFSDLLNSLSFRKNG